MINPITGYDIHRDECNERRNTSREFVDSDAKVDNSALAAIHHQGELNRINTNYY